MHTLAEVRDAYAHGWASIPDAPLTARVKAVCANHLHGADLDDPGLIEATIDIGRLEGVWAVVHTRREHLHTRHDHVVMTVWRAIVAELPTRDAVTRFRAAVTEADDPDQTRRKAAAAAAAAWLLAHARTSPQRQHLLDALTAAVRDGMAEGATAAILIAAERAGRTADPDLVHAARLAEAAVPDGVAAHIEAAILAASTRTAARTLTALDSGDNGDEGDGLGDTLTGDNSPAALTTDTAVGTAYTAGMLGIWARLGARTTTWLTVGDERVCERCLTNEAGSPYPLLSAPACPAHPRCRCVCVTDDDYPTSALAALIPLDRPGRDAASAAGDAADGDDQPDD